MYKYTKSTTYQLDNTNLSQNGFIPTFGPTINFVSIIKQNIIININMKQSCKF